MLIFKSFQKQIPNGDKIQVESSPWPGVGHVNRGGGGTRNSFGIDFSAAGQTWTSELCKKDSDGDGLSNGDDDAGDDDDYYDWDADDDDDDDDDGDDDDDADGDDGDDDDSASAGGDAYL